MSPFHEHAQLIAAINESDIIPAQCWDIALALRFVFFGGNKVVACGNGGSAADAEHFVAELVGKFKNVRRAYPAIALSSAGPTMTAIANDWDYAYVFSRQAAALVRDGDMFFAISTSGESENVCNAAQVAKDRGAIVITLTGRDGGRLKQWASTAICVPSDVTARIQEMHALILHAICEGLEDE